MHIIFYFFSFSKLNYHTFSHLLKANNVQLQKGMKQILGNIKQFAKINSAHHIFEVLNRKNLLQENSTHKI